MDTPSNTARAGRFGRYALIVAGAILLTGVMKPRIDGIVACPASYDDDAYLAYCQALGYGDYDRGGFWFDLEPGAKDAAAAADVLFLGSSRMQFGFSSAATRAWFAEARTRFYLLGFSHTENVRFAGPLLDRLKPHAKVYVVNVDSFFDDRLTKPTQLLFTAEDAGPRYVTKRRWQAVHAKLCVWLAPMCGTHAAFYRHRQDGVWHLAGTEPGFVPAPVTDGPLDPDAATDRYAEIAADFVARLPVERDCVLLTLVPYAGTKREEAEIIAKHLGIDLVEPRPGMLRTFDGSHLEPESAELFSKAFFDLAGDRISQCVSGTSSRAP